MPSELIFLCKIILISTKSAQVSIKIHILKLKMQQPLGPTWGPRHSAYRLIYLVTKPVLKNKFTKMLRIFYIEIDIL